MQDEKYSIDGKWPNFKSQNDMFDWLEEQRDIKAGRCASHGSQGISPDAAESSNEPLSAV